MPKLLLLQVGRTFEELAQKRGDYDLWFREALGVVEADLEVAYIVDGAPLPSHHDYRGIVVTGSAAMVTDREPWSLATAAYLREALARSVPLLGVCYGHQLLAAALGGRVADNPRGRMVGTVELSLSPEAREDPLFSALPERALVQLSHRQSVLELPASSTLLAAHSGDPYAAFRLGPSAWGVQFHPEFDADITRHYIDLRRDVIHSEGGDPDALLGRVRESPYGRVLLERFAALAA